MDVREKELESLRTKTQMVFAGIERDLVSFLKNKGQDTDTTINDLLSSKARNNDLDQDVDPITRVYFKDLWEVAVRIEDDNVVKSKLQRIARKAFDKSIILARNASAHANKPFLKHYWYSVASLASSPDLETIGFEITKSQLRKAELNQLSDDFELDRVDNYIKHIPNNLPPPDWQKTKFWGRIKERQELNQVIFRGRNNSICVCGPGGIGKTALLLKVAEDVSTSGDFDFIFFYSFKSEFLSEEGVKKIDTKSTLEEFTKDFDEFKLTNLTGQDNNVNGLLLLDNLEDLLVNNDRRFMDCIDKFPANWKIISTSRLQPNGFKILTLDALDDKTGINLGMSYAKLSGDNKLAAAFEQNKLEHIKICASNPLAIKLSIDLLKRGLPISDAGQQAISMVTDFSFRNLQQLFDENTILLLEYLRQGGKADLFTICAELDFDTELCLTVLENIKNTSLVRIHPGDGDDIQYENTELTSNFLLEADNIVKVRAKIADVIKQRSQQTSAVNSLNTRIFRSLPSAYRAPENIPAKGLRVIESLFKIRSFCRQTERRSVRNEDIPPNMAEYLKKWEAIPNTFKKEGYFFLIRGRIFELLFDNRAEDDFQRHLKHTGHTKNAYIVLASYFQRQENYVEASKIYKDALSRFPEDSFFNTGYCVSLQYTNDLENISLAIDHMRPKVANNETYAQTFVQAVRRGMEGSIISVNLDDIKTSIELCIKHMHLWASKTMLGDFIDQLFYVLDKREYDALDKQLNADLIFDLVESYLSQGGVIKKLYAAKSQPIESYLEGFFKKLGCTKDTKLLELSWAKFKESAYTENESLLIEIKEKKLMVVKLRNVHPLQGFCFGVSKGGEEFFIHYKSITEEFEGATDTLEVGSVLAITPSSHAKKEYRKSETAYIIPENWFQYSV